MTTNINTWTKGFCAAITGACSWVYGGLDMLLKVLIVCVMLDYLSGVFAAWYTKTLNSQVGYKGILKKIVILLLVALGSLLGQVLQQPAIRDIVIGFYIANEGISILENAARMDIPICKGLIKFLEQLKSENDSDEDTE